MNLGQAPKPAKDLYLDLRDRRLLPVVIGLLVAIVAVPLLIGGDDEEALPSAADEVATEADADAGISAPAVLAKAPELREFDKRLESFKERNPFEQQLADPAPSKSGGGGSTGGSSAGGAPSTSASSSGSSGGGSDAPAPPPSDPPPKRPPDSNEIILFSWEVDVKVTVEGEQSERKGVKELDFVPGEKRPVLQFIRGDFDETEAVFIVSRNVSDSEGGGRCSPSDESCEFVLLKEGEARSFTYEPEGRSYRIKLTKVRLIQERVDADKLSTEDLKKRAEQSYADLSARIRG